MPYLTVAENPVLDGFKLVTETTMLRIYGFILVFMLQICFLVTKYHG